MKSRNHYYRILLISVMMFIFVFNRNAYADVITPGVLIMAGAFMLIIFGIFITVIVLLAVLIIRHIKKKHRDNNKLS